MAKSIDPHYYSPHHCLPTTVVLREHRHGREGLWEAQEEMSEAPRPSRRRRSAAESLEAFGFIFQNGGERLRMPSPGTRTILRNGRKGTEGYLKALAFFYCNRALFQLRSGRVQADSA